MTNPTAAGSYPISVETFTKDNELIDKGESLIVINSVVGKATAFNAYAVQREDDLQAGNRGPFHLRMMLSNNMPKTNDTE
jgi:hypothetical protein